MFGVEQQYCVPSFRGQEKEGKDEVLTGVWCLGSSALRWDGTHMADSVKSLDQGCRM